MSGFPAEMVRTLQVQISQLTPRPELFFRENPILQRPEASGKQEILGNNRARIITKSTFKAGPLPPVGKGFSKAECIWLPSK